MSPALAGGFLTTAPPGKSDILIISYPSKSYEGYYLTAVCEPHLKLTFINGTVFL